MGQCEFEWKYTDDETIQNIYNFFCENLNMYGGCNTSVGWDCGVFNKGNTFFITKYQSLNGCLLHTGTDADDWFYIDCLVFIKKSTTKTVKEIVSYKCSLGRNDIVITHIPETIKEYSDIVTKAIIFREDYKQRQELYDKRMEDEKILQKEKIECFIKRLKEKKIQYGNTN